MIGFFTADGCKAAKSRPHEFIFYNTDITLLEEIRRILSSDKKIQMTEKIDGRYGKKVVGRLAISNPKIAKFLRSIECYDVKENRSPFKYIPEEFKYAYIKGLFDGDGNVYKEQISIAGKFELLDEIYTWININTGIPKNKIHQTTSSNKTHYITFSKTNSNTLGRLLSENAPETFNSDKFKKLI